MAAAVVLVLLASAGTQALGMEAILGAFLCGVLVGSAGTTAASAKESASAGATAASAKESASAGATAASAKESASAGQLDRQRLAPLRTFVMTVLAPLFFATAGLRMDLTGLARPLVLASALAVLAVAVVGKFAGAYVGARAARLGHWPGLALGAGLNARGVVEVVVATVGLRLGVLGQEAYTIIVLIAIATSLMAPPMLRYAARRIAVTAEENNRAAAYSVGSTRALDKLAPPRTTATTVLPSEGAA